MFYDNQTRKKTKQTHKYLKKTCSKKYIQIHNDTQISLIKGDNCVKEY